MLDYPYAGMGIYKREVLNKLNIKFQKDLRSAEDRIFFLRLFYEASSYAVSTESGYFYRKESVNTLTTNGEKTQLDVFAAIRAMLDYSRSKIDDVNIKYKITEMSLSLIYFHAKNRARLNAEASSSFNDEAFAIYHYFDQDLLREIISTSSSDRRNILNNLFRK